MVSLFCHLFGMKKLRYVDSALIDLESGSSSRTICHLQMSPMTRKRVSGPVLSDEERIIKEGDIRFVQVNVVHCLRFPQ
jgi:hypothetical protein